MAVTTNTWERALAEKLSSDEQTAKPVERRREFVWLSGASIVVALGLAAVFLAKTQDFSDLQQRLRHGELLNVNALQSADQLMPALQVIAGSSERQTVAQKLYEYAQLHRPLPNIGALAHIRMDTAGPDGHPRLIPLAKIKPLLAVRTPQEFTKEFALWAGAYLAAFWIVHFAWRLFRFRGDGAILPALQILTGLGLILMVSLRDPLRDTLEFKKFAWGVVLGCATLLFPLFRALQYRQFSRWVYTPLLAALALFLALLAFGSGPTGSDAKVNLGPFQPVEAVKILLVFFLAGYFTNNWERLRDLHPRLVILRWLRIPRFSDVLPVMCGVACALVLFFALKDMGPALVIGFVFLSLFAVARGRAGLALFGIAALIAGVSIGYHYGAPHTVVDRVSMWLSPWDNNVHGGDQLAHSLWAFATGGPWGSGPGWGDPSVIPAGHTDLVLPAIAEEWGLPGVITIFLLFALLLHRSFRIALRAPDEYAMFLGLGLATLLSLEMLLISGGVLGAIPLSGVVSPFLSSGNTAMLANFFIFSVLVGISNQTAKIESAADESQQQEREEQLETFFKTPSTVLACALGLCGIALVYRAVSLEAFQDDALLAKDAFVFTQDKVKRPQHNPRLNLLAASIPRGNIFDRNGVLLATSNWAELEKRRADYQKLGIDIDTASPRLDSRLYPFGPATIHFLGDLRTGENFHATNASLVEHDSNARLQGYKDYADLAPVVRYRHQKTNPQLVALMNRDRDVHTTIDIRLQLKIEDILRNQLQAAGKKGAMVVMNPANGDVLALVSWPAPASNTPAPDELLDRARYGQYPPGSTFKLVTAMAALRLDPKATEKTYNCHGLGDGRVGTIIPGWRRPIRDDVKDHAHGTLNMAAAITVSCNAYFAQLGVYNVGAQALRDTTELLGIPSGELKDLKKMLPFAAYGQGPLLTTPFKMARVAATIADGGSMAEGRWVSDPSNTRTTAPLAILAPDSAEFLQRAMRSVVTSGTARSAMAGIAVDVAGKTGTAQLDSGDPHSWFAGFAPYDAPHDQQIAFAVVVEHGGYGAKFAAPIARQVVEASQQLGIIKGNSTEVQ
jgi:cell division protein FtsI/penicillin-binding protein 2/cell division protein FtsW (lipid II flippase)